MSKWKDNNCVNIGDLVVDNYGRLGIVMGRAICPNEYWFEKQNDERLRDMCDTNEAQYEFWLNVYPLTGGAVVTPASLVEMNFGQANENAFGKAYENANKTAQETLEMLPIYCEYRKNPLATV